MKTVKVKSIKPIGEQRVVDIIVHKNHTFVTDNGIVVHNCNSTQPALRNFMEEYSKNCGFILTCNFKNRIIEPLHSRCTNIEFKVTKEDKQQMAASFFKRIMTILKKENVVCESKQAVAQLITDHFPDFRRVLNELQGYAATGKIDAGILTASTAANSNVESLIQILKERKFDEMRKWVAENSDIEAAVIYRKLYDSASKHMTPISVAQLIITLADYQYKSAFVADREINNAACFTQIMTDTEWL